ncbi:hypothetical protein PR048_020412 [Dryococelus australis]|uniref:Uncharacterized protein n=1 Tax=Dryococelus australis TaxID=614101 RepID=A0ABQ9H681_9NEOP|nr:hypothetical protein PR048_020412 [Dryococelus australis]
MLLHDQRKLCQTLALQNSFFRTTREVNKTTDMSSEILHIESHPTERGVPGELPPTLIFYALGTWEVVCGRAPRRGCRAGGGEVSRSLKGCLPPLCPQPGRAGSLLLMPRARAKCDQIPERRVCRRRACALMEGRAKAVSPRLPNMYYSSATSSSTGSFPSEHKLLPIAFPFLESGPAGGSATRSRELANIHCYKCRRGPHGCLHDLLRRQTKQLSASSAPFRYVALVARPAWLTRTRRVDSRAGCVEWRFVASGGSVEWGYVEDCLQLALPRTPSNSTAVVSLRWQVELRVSSAATCVTDGTIVSRASEDELFGNHGAVAGTTPCNCNTFQTAKSDTFAPFVSPEPTLPGIEPGSTWWETNVELSYFPIARPLCHSVHVEMRNTIDIFASVCFAILFLSTPSLALPSPLLLTASFLSHLCFIFVLTRVSCLPKHVRHLSSCCYKSASGLRGRELMSAWSLSDCATLSDRRRARRETSGERSDQHDEKLEALRALIEGLNSQASARANSIREDKIVGISESVNTKKDSDDKRMNSVNFKIDSVEYERKHKISVLEKKY